MALINYTLGNPPVDFGCLEIPEGEDPNTYVEGWLSKYFPGTAFAIAPSIEEAKRSIAESRFDFTTSYNFTVLPADPTDGKSIEELSTEARRIIENACVEVQAYLVQDALVSATVRTAERLASSSTITSEDIDAMEPLASARGLSITEYANLLVQTREASDRLLTKVYSHKVETLSELQSTTDQSLLVPKAKAAREKILSLVIKSLTRNLSKWWPFSDDESPQSLGQVQLSESEGRVTLTRASGLGRCGVLISLNDVGLIPTHGSEFVVKFTVDKTSLYRLRTALAIDAENTLEAGFLYGLSPFDPEHTVKFNLKSSSSLTVVENTPEHITFSTRMVLPKKADSFFFRFASNTEMMNVGVTFRSIIAYKVSN